MKNICPVEGCTREQYWKSRYCRKHLYRIEKYGRFLLPKEEFLISLPENCIALTQGKYAIVDEGLFNYLSQYSWVYVSGYAVRKKKKGEKNNVFMHREILGAKRGQICDHINRNTLDNRGINLRICDLYQSARNRSRAKDNKWGFHGVSKQKKKWIGRVFINDKTYRTFTCKTPHEAAKARDVLAIRLHGKFAFLNFPSLA